MNDLKNLKYLLPNTQKLLLKIIESCDFLDKYVLVGGSALAMHICHRKSEYLDFFTYEDAFNKREIYGFLKYFEQKEILNETNEQIDLLLDGVKVTFFNASWSFLKPEVVSQFNLASLEQIATMKTNVLFLRAKYRDYYDIYSLVKTSMTLRRLFECGLGVVEGINFKLFSVALLYIDDIEDDNIDYLEPIEVLTKEKIRDFFQLELKKVNG